MLASMKAYSKSVFPLSSCWCRKAAFLTFWKRAMCRVWECGRCSRLRDCRRYGGVAMVGMAGLDLDLSIEICLTGGGVELDDM